ncbi:MAG: hypothetical protein JWR15_434 [Prosthecobacter sp.]|nr:hypothetical protein [Prosthecobacter sp.]
MNVPYDIAADIPIPDSFTTPATQFENCVRKNPGSTLLLAAGIGLTAILIARALTPPPPRNRALRLLEDIQQQLATLAEEGAHAVGKGVDSFNELHLDRSFGKLSRRFKNLFH